MMGGRLGGSAAKTAWSARVSRNAKMKDFFICRVAVFVRDLSKLHRLPPHPGSLPGGRGRNLVRPLGLLLIADLIQLGTK